MYRGLFATFLLGMLGAPYFGPQALAQSPAQETQQQQGQQAPAQGQNADQGKVPELPPVRVIEPEKKAQGPKEAQRKRASRPRREAAVARQATPATNTEAEASAQQANISLSPVPGAAVPLEKVPGAVSQVSGATVERQPTPTVQDALQHEVPGINLSDVQGNAFQTTIQYRGFESSPVNGTPQGIAVYQNGVRINEVFGDIVNWDFLPSNAIKNITVLSGNPLFGLNALGGAISVTMQDGFGFHGVESDTRFGSWGRRQESLQTGVQSGNIAAYVAVESIHDDGWRVDSPSAIHRMYADIGAKPTSDSEFHINYSAATNFIGAVAPSPIEFLAQDWSKVFTRPQTTLNRMSMLSMNGSVAVTPDWKISGVGYYRQFRQKHLDANLSDAQACDGNNPTGPLCLDGDPVLDRAGNPIDNSFGDNVGEIDRTRDRADSYGASLQATNNTPLFGHANQFVIGTSIDHGVANVKTNAEFGTIDDSLVITGNGVFPFFPLGLTPENLITTTNYYGLFFMDSFDVTKRLTITAGGRYNFARINLDDLNAAFKAAAFPGEDSSLSGDHIFVRFNPSIGATYKLTPNLSLYGGYSEANRAPTPAELACSNPNQPCLLENFLVSDPDLKQVVSHTWEAGVRGHFTEAQFSGAVNWSLGLFHTLNVNDIINITDPNQPTRGFFQNAGNTLRQGIEAKVSYKLPRASVYANYALVDATYRNTLVLPSPNNPLNVTNDPAFSIVVHPGDHLPAIPEHRVKVGFDYSLTEEWKAGADLVYASSQFFRGDESNQNAKLPSYTVVNLHTSYDLNKNIQLYGIINNLFDNHYTVFGTYFAAQEVNLTDPRTETPAQPFSVYGGVRIKF